MRYAIYGVFAFCPDCGSHNSFRILAKSLEVAGRKVALARSVEDAELADHIVGDALGNAVAAVDGFGREALRVWGVRQLPPKELSVKFQNLEGARQAVQREIGIDIASTMTAEEWEFLCRCFQKRHLLSHRLGVVDEDYLKKAKDPEAVLGRKIRVTKEEVTRLLEVLSRFGSTLSILAGAPPQSPPFQ